MTELRQRIGRVVLSNSLEIAYLSEQQMEQRKRDREKQRKARKVQLWLAAIVVSVCAVIFGLHLRTVSEHRLEEFHQLQQTADGPIRAFEGARDGGMVLRFAQPTLDPWQRNIRNMQYHLSKLEENPEDAAMQSYLRGDINGAATSCHASEAAVKQELVNESNARCPKHPGYARNSEDSMCHHGSPSHYAFDAWKRGGSYCWRTGGKKAGCVRLSEIHLCD